MPPKQTLLGWRRHWIGFLFLLPVFPLAAFYHARAVAERVPRLEGSDIQPLYEYHLMPFTEFLGNALFWVFWGGILAFVINAIYLRHLGQGWVWTKLLILPLYFAAAVFWSFHVE